MSLDPKTLTRGDIVIFGNAIEQEVTGFSRWETNGCVQFGHHSIYDDNPIWQIAELKEPEPKLPSAVGGCWPAWTLKGRFYVESYQQIWGKHNMFAPENLLEHAKSIVKELEEAGVPSWK